MSSFQFAPQQFPQRETQKNYVFVDEHNRHKRLKVMRACEGCRRRKIKCDAATTNTWPCSACIRLKLHCVRPNGFDAPDNGFDVSPDGTGQFTMQQMGQTTPKQSYPPSSAYSDGSAGSYQQVAYDSMPPQQSVHYTTVPPPVGMVNSSYSDPSVFPTPPLPISRADEPSPETYSPDSYQQQDLSDLLGSLKVDEKGTAPYLRNKASFRQEEEPAFEDDDDFDVPLPPLSSRAGSKIRVPPELMPSEETCVHYFDLYFTHVHPYVPVLDRAAFYRQWHTSRETISPLILEAMFAIGGRLAEDPAQGQQWLALATRHADAFMDVPRLSTLQALLMILKAREAAPKRGYFFRSWMTVVQCVEMAKDLGLDEHFEDHQAGRPCESSQAECQLRTRIWQTVFVCEVMVGTPQGRHDLAVDPDTVNLHNPTGGHEYELEISRNFTQLARIVRFISNMSHLYARLKKKRRKEWGLDPHFQQINQDFQAFLPDLPAGLIVNFPADGSPPWLPTSFHGNLHSYYYLCLILCHRPQLTFLDPNAPDGQWKHHMKICYSAAKKLCRLQEALIHHFGLLGLQCMQRGFSFTVYAGLSCVILHLVAIISPDPEFNSDAREYFTRHMRIMEKVIEVWQMPELQKQIDAVREAFSADIRKPFVLKPSFPYGSPHPSNSSTSPRGHQQSYRPTMDRSRLPQQTLDTQSAQQVSYANHPMTPPISAGPMDSKSDSPLQSLVVMPQASQAPGMSANMPLPDQSAWNPSRIFEQWNTTFGAMETPSIQDIQAVGQIPNTQAMAPQHYVAAPTATFVTPAMWQESVASVYEGGLKRGWDFDPGQLMKRQ
jgi:hypothetical protein